LLTQIETQASSRHRPSKIALETHKFFEEQGKFIRGNARSSICDTDLHLWRRLMWCRTDDHGSLFGAILEGVGKQIAEDLAHIVLIGPDSYVFAYLQAEIIGLRLAWIEVVKYIPDYLGN